MSHSNSFEYRFGVVMNSPADLIVLMSDINVFDNSVAFFAAIAAPTVDATTRLSASRKPSAFP